jgi:hypothetical protein
MLGAGRRAVLLPLAAASIPTALAVRLATRGGWSRASDDRDDDDDDGDHRDYRGGHKAGMSMWRLPAVDDNGEGSSGEDGTHIAGPTVGAGWVLGGASASVAPGVAVGLAYGLRSYRPGGGEQFSAVHRQGERDRVPGNGYLCVAGWLSVGHAPSTLGRWSPG